MKKIVFRASIVVLILTSTGCASSSGALPERDCIVLNTFSTDKSYPPWKIYDDLNASMETIRKDAQDNGTNIGAPYYKLWISRTNEFLDAKFRQIEADAGKASVGLGDGEIKNALEAVAADASPGNLGILEGLSARCLAN